MSSQPKIVVVGGGPTGLGAAVRLTELGYDNWTLLDASEIPGGLSRSFKDPQGFTWDFGGHVIFSHYQYFDDLMDATFANKGESGDVGWNRLQRESWVRICGTWVPYPFQLNIHRLPEKERQECLEGLEAVHSKEYPQPAATFEEYIHRQFGAGIAKHFMLPYNLKVWAIPPREMTVSWMGERVAAVDLDRIKKNLKTREDDVGWGPNATFRFPQRGGTGAIYIALKEKLLPKPKCQFGGKGSHVVGILPKAKKLQMADGSEQHYDTLISTMALDDVLCMIAAGMETEGEAGKTAGYPYTPGELRTMAKDLWSNSTHIVGFGLKGQCPPHIKTTCWMYFPGDETPFYRCTVFSNYAKDNVPDPATQWSLMLECNYTPAFKPQTMSQQEIIDACLKGCVAADLMTEQDAKENVVSVFYHNEKKGYPLPSLTRDAPLKAVQPWLRDSLGIYSRGRFGGWRYEVGNQDHSLMQGVEAVDAVVKQSGVAVPASVTLIEGEPTYNDPNKVNSTRNTMPCTLTAKK